MASCVLPSYRHGPDAIARCTQVHGSATGEDALHDTLQTLTSCLTARIILVCRRLDQAERGRMGTFVPTPQDVERQWHVIDAEGQVLGRVATLTARLLQG